MKLTKAEAIQKCRDMWNWIADETERRNCVVDKEEYFVEHGMEENEVVNGCYLCEYDFAGNPEFKTCHFCPIDFGEVEEYDEEGCRNNPCIDALDSPFRKWNIQMGRCWAVNGEYDILAKFAREIANLPEREV